MPIEGMGAQEAAGLVGRMRLASASPASMTVVGKDLFAMSAFMGDAYAVRRVDVFDFERIICPDSAPDC